MGYCQSKSVQQQILVSKEIDKQLNKEGETIVIKLLLLGTADSGKSTVLKQMRLLHTDGFSDEELHLRTMIVRSTIITSMALLIRQMNTLNICFDEPEREDDGNLILHQLETKQDSVPMTDQVYKAAKHLWRDKGIQECFSLRDKFHLGDYTKYFLDDIDRIHQPDYRPTVMDILQLRVPTMGIEEVQFNIKKVNFSYMVFQNRMSESLELFSSICVYFRRASIVLFLNKIDLFATKVQHVSIRTAFPEYEGIKGKDLIQIEAMSVNQTYEMSDNDKTNVFRFGIYIVQGCVVMVTNGLIMLPIVWYKALRSRKEYFIIGAMAFTDITAGISTAAAGIWRIPLLVSGDYRTSVTRQYCLSTPHVLMWTFLGPAGFCMLTVVSLDRAIAVGKPLCYLGLKRSYAQVLVLGCYSFSFVVGIFTFVTSWTSVEPVKANKICISSMAWGMEAHAVLDPINVLLISIAIGLYALVPVFYHKYLKGACDNDGPNVNQLKLQKQLAKTTGFSCFATFVFVALPMIVRSVVAIVFGSQKMFNSIVPWFVIIGKVNPTLNFFIYFKRQKEMRMGLMGVFSNKIMPANLDLWESE